MAKKNKIYVTTMYRYGDIENDSYVVCAGFSKSKAIDIGEEVKEQRGGKYHPRVVEFTPDKPETRKTILELE